MATSAYGRKVTIGAGDGGEKEPFGRATDSMEVLI